MSPLSRLEPCPDCGAPLPPIDGPTHPYIGGSAACWQAFGELGAREIGMGIPGADRLSVHVYAVQHPGSKGRRQAQSVDIHLMVLGAVLERGFGVSDAVRAMQGWLRGPSATWPWLTPPPSPASRTILSLPASANPERHVVAVRAWAEAVWAAWSEHRPTVRRWLDGDRPGR